MKSRQDGQGVPPYAAETAREIGNLGAGGHGNFEGRSDAANRGVTPARVAEAKVRAVGQKQRGNDPKHSGIMEPSHLEPHSPVNETERTRHATMPATTQNTDQKIREKAHELWILEGRPDGRDLSHWEMARELVAQEEGLDSTLLPIHSSNGEVENAVAALDNEGEAPGLTDQGKDDSDALRVSPAMATPSPVKKKAARSKA